MKWTTANVKNPNYSNNHEIYVGTQTGSFKKLTPSFEDNPFQQRNLQNLSDLDKESGITALSFADELKSEILIGRQKNIVEVHSVKTDQTSYKVEFSANPVVGLARYDNQIVAGYGNGQIQCITMKGDEQDKTATEMLLKAGDEMSHLRQCAAQTNIIATGGKGRQNNLKIFDLAMEGKQIFSSKNLPNDYLQLEVPVWDSDVGFIDSPSVLATCSRHGYVRLYDTRKQRRPVQYFATEDQLSFKALVATGNYIYTGTTMGALKAFDIRRMKTFVHTYKGCTGSINDLCLDASGKYLTSACLDRYVRVHNVDSCVLMYQCYVKSKATSVILRESLEKPNCNADDANAEEEEDDEVAASQSINKSKSSKTHSSTDKEYEDLFENMQTICENDEAIDEEVSPAIVSKTASKRKNSTKSLKLKTKIKKN